MYLTGCINLVFALIVLHNVEGRDIIVNSELITSMREARDADEPGHAFTDGIRCMISLADGKYVTVVEECDAIQGIIKNAETGSN